MKSMMTKMKMVEVTMGKTNLEIDMEGSPHRAAVLEEALLVLEEALEEVAQEDLVVVLALEEVEVLLPDLVEVEVPLIRVPEVHPLEEVLVQEPLEEALPP